jgi:hypothetical protein
MDEILTRIWENLGARVTGPMSFRLVLQPTVAAILAIKAGLKDARSGRPPYFWTILHTDASGRRELLGEGWSAIAKVFCLAILLDGVYQMMVQGWFYPGEALIVGLVLACLPYLLIRGPVARWARRSTSGDRVGRR